MGYYTKYELTTYPACADSDVRAHLCLLPSYIDSLKGDCKWYEHDDDMLAASRAPG